MSDPTFTPLFPLPFLKCPHCGGAVGVVLRPTDTVLKCVRATCGDISATFARGAAAWRVSPVDMPECNPQAHVYGQTVMREKVSKVDQALMGHPRLKWDRCPRCGSTLFYIVSDHRGALDAYCGHAHHWFATLPIGSTEWVAAQERRPTEQELAARKGGNGHLNVPDLPVFTAEVDADIDPADYVDLLEKEAPGTGNEFDPATSSLTTNN